MSQVAPRTLARGASASLAGAVAGGALGLILTVVISRTLGDTGAGVVFQAMAVFMITLSLTELGMDTATLWLIPRLLVSDPGSVRTAVRTVLFSTLLSGLVGTVVVIAATFFLDSSPEVLDAVRAGLLFQPLAAAMTALLSSLRAMSGVRGYVLINNVVLPTYRPLAVLACAAMGTGSTAVTLSWAGSYAVGFVLAVWLNFRVISRIPETADDPQRPARDVARQLLKFGASRIISSAAQQVLLWSDVLIVGAILGSSEAGVYGTVIRFFSAILLVDTALRLVVSPMFSRLLHQEDVAGLQELYRRCTAWLNLLSAPGVILLAVFAPTLLEIISPGFGSGAGALRILSLGMLVVFAAGAIHNLLLMSGRSLQAAANKVAAMVLNLAANVILIPLMGINGAALSWVVAMGLDAALALVQVRRNVGVHPDLRPVAVVLALTGITVALPATLVVVVMGQNAAALLTAVTVVTPTLALGVWLTRASLHINDLLPGRKV